MPRHRIAAIDVGTNSIHMIVVEQQRHGYRVIDREKEMVQLGRGSLEGRPLTAEAIERGVEALKQMAGIAERWKVKEVVAVATSAIREASNGRRFLAAAQKAAGIRLRVITGEEEADYIYRAVRAAMDFHGGTALVIDIGGGSVELIAGTQSEVFLTASEPLGALRMAQQFGLEAAATPAMVDQCRSFVRKTLKKPLARIGQLGFDFSVGTSGTIVTLATLAMSANGEGVASGLRWLSRKRLRELIDALTPLSAADRARRYTIDEKRGETLLAGAIVLDEIMRRLEIEQLRACDAALREGIVERVLDRISEDGKPRGGGSVRRSSVMALVERSDVERTHAEQVARLALRIFDQTQELHHFRTGERELLEYAALLHEVGMHVSYQEHQKHSYYMISHAGLRGFTSDQVSVVANVARYYRKATPSEDHENFAPLSASQKEIVRKLAAILRIADALDRGRGPAGRGGGGGRGAGTVPVATSEWNGATERSASASGSAAMPRSSSPRSRNGRNTSERCTKPMSTSKAAQPKPSGSRKRAPVPATPSAPAPERFVVLLRHGIAEDPTPGKPDAERGLTAEGHGRMKQISRGLERAVPKAQAIYSSPLLRAVQTALWVSKGYRSRVTVTTSEALAPGASMAEFLEFIGSIEARRAIVVGHEPSLSEGLRALVQLGPSPAFELKKGGCFGIRLMSDGTAVLEWVLPPRILRKLGE